MPAVSQKQQEYMAIQEKEAKEGKSHKVPLSVSKEFSGTKRTGLPVRKSNGRKLVTGRR